MGPLAIDCLCKIAERSVSTRDYNLGIALRLAKAGLHVFPIGPNKRPLICDWDETSTTDAAVIRRWWHIRGDPLVAIDLRKAGLVVIDADRHGGPDGMAAWHGLVRESDRARARSPATPVARTPSGGLHIYFSQPGGGPLGNREGSLPKGINVRGAGGYVVAPYCIRADGTYYELVKSNPDLVEAFTAGRIPPVPDWLTKIIRETNPGATDGQTVWSSTVSTPTLPTSGSSSSTIGTGTARITHSNGNRYEAYARAALSGQVAEVSATPSGGRNIALNAAAFRLGRLAARGWISRTDIEAGLQSAAQSNGLLAEDGERSVNATINSGLCAGLAKPAEEPGARK